MSGQACSSCGCSTQQCGCCTGAQTLTPASRYNRPGLPELSYRVGTHAQFLQSMQARLSTMTVDGVALDGQTLATFHPLQGLTTRASDDFSLALLDSWAAVGDVLSFYQERIANEGFLRTATERRSVLELSRLVGYTLRPGVAATVYLAYTLDANQTEPVLIASGARSQSIPGPDEQAQFFETSEDLMARREWNNLQVRLKQPQNITLENAQVLESLDVAGTSTNLRPGDKVLFVFAGAPSKEMVARSVLAVETQLADARSVVRLQPVAPLALAKLPALNQCIAALRVLSLEQEAQLPPDAGEDEHSQAYYILRRAEAVRTEFLLSGEGDPLQWVDRLWSTFGRGETSDELEPPLEAFEAAVLQSEPPGPERVITNADAIVAPLRKKPIPQVANSLRLPRELGAAFTDRSDNNPRLLLKFAPELSTTFYTALKNATVNDAIRPLEAVYALRTRAALFGAVAARPAEYFPVNSTTNPPGALKPQDQWTGDWTYDDEDKADNAFLDQAVETIALGSYVLIQSSEYERPARQVLQVRQAVARPRTAYGLSGPSTELQLDRAWRAVQTKPNKFDSTTTRLKIGPLRKSQLYVQSEVLQLVDTPITTPVDTQEIELGAVYDGLTSGRWVILSGERVDIPGVRGVPVSELVMLSGVQNDYNSQLPGDTTHTRLTLATKPAYRYKRDTLTIYGNVVKATHGATVNEVLGSGDGAQSLQSFALKQPPLTFVAAPTAAGAQSTLQIYVDDVAWSEAESLAFLGPKDRGFVTATDDASVTTVRFGNGVHGARLPSGVENVRALYRTGIGAGGNVKAQQISLLQTRPQGVQAVINPLRASGGADKESRDLARENAPLSVLPLERLVGIQDYADFTRRFAGIAKARAARASDGRRSLVQLTIAGTDDVPIDPDSDLYRNLLEALYRFGDPDLPLSVELRELQILVLSARLKVLPSHRYEKVASAVRGRLLTSFGFNNRSLGQPVCTSEVISVIQSVAGVAYVDIDAFGAIPEKVEAEGGTRRLPLQSEIAGFVEEIITGESPSQTYGQLRGRYRLPEGVSAWPGGADRGVLRPAELAIFTPAVPDTLILNRIP